jgi:hypothetical protein
MKILYSCTVFLFIQFSLFAQTHLDDLRILQENVLPENNSYTDSKSIVHWKGFNNATQYICHTNCSGLVDALLIHSYHLDRKELHRWIGGQHHAPKAKDYYDVINQQKGFSKITNINNIAPGDFIAIKFLPGAKNAAHDTGHIMVVNAAPIAMEKPNEQMPNAKHWSVEIIDCSHGHGKNDTRFYDEKFHPGIGKGHFALFADAQGTIIGYSWSNAPHSHFYGSTQRPLEVGRLNLNFK